jgi:hypothetical protein
MLWGEMEKGEVIGWKCYSCEFEALSIQAWNDRQKARKMVKEWIEEVLDYEKDAFMIRGPGSDELKELLELL